MVPKSLGLRFPPMTDDPIERLAAELVRRFGGGAAMEAGHLAEKARRIGDAGSAKKWNTVAAVARRLQDGLPAKYDSDFLE
jgi:hypothetical protein